MNLITAVLAESEEHFPLIFPAPVFAVIAFAIFLVLGIVTWTYRDVANRHSEKFTTGGHDAHDSHGAGH